MIQNKQTTNQPVRVIVKRNNKLVISHALGQVLEVFIYWLSDVQKRYS